MNLNRKKLVTSSSVIELNGVQILISRQISSLQVQIEFTECPNSLSKPSEIAAKTLRPLGKKTKHLLREAQLARMVCCLLSTGSVYDFHR